MRAKGQGGIYFYFFCRGRQEGTCIEPFLPIAVVEQAVINHYDEMCFDQPFIVDFRSQIVEVMNDDQHSTTLLRRDLQIRLDKLDVQESNLIDLAAETSSAKQKVRSRLIDIDLQRQNLRDELASINSDLEVGAGIANFALDLLAQPDQLYRRLTDAARRELNQAVFNKLYVYRHSVVEDDIREPFRQIIHMERQTRDQQVTCELDRPKNSPEMNNRPGSWEDRLAGCLSKTSMVGVRRFELPASTSRTWRANQAALHPVATHDAIRRPPLLPQPIRRRLPYRLRQRVPAVPARRAPHASATADRTA